MLPKAFLPIAVIAVLIALLSCEGYEPLSESQALYSHGMETSVETSEITFVFQTDDMPFGFSEAEVRVISPKGLDPQVRMRNETEVEVTVIAVKGKPFYSTIIFRGENEEDTREFHSLVEASSEEAIIFYDLAFEPDLHLLRP